MLRNYNSILKSIRIRSQKNKFYRRAVLKFLCTMCNQCGMFYSLYWEYELKILRVNVKLIIRGIYCTEKYARQRLMRLTVLLRLQHFSCFYNTSIERSRSGAGFRIFSILVALSLRVVLRLSNITPGGSESRVVRRNTRRKRYNKKKL